ncbi:MAG: twin-arginine translocase subunit TatC [Burkholderiales bacterium]|jgi:sec-independent protein translocase protein TatC|nr:twin-arginine translocase subunit TatC [Burkholderiales bacterium]MCA3224481.1 twin-arginine translocase subunit TatC [Burkholderiales bacterium]MCE2645481.1 twin-arginine translocase subunit TatC [Burkholderiaceae bacterium]
MSTPPDNEQASAATGEEQSFISHLVELRQRLVRAALAVLVVFLCLTPFMKPIFDLLSRPMMVALPEGTKLLATGVITPFMVPLKLTMFTAFVIALPYVLYQAWAFVAPGLYKHEKRLAAPIIVSSVGMFLLGMTYCYFIVFGFVFKFIAGFAPATVAVAPDIEAYFSFVLGMFMAFGLAFEMPIVVVLLARFGIASLDALRKARPYVIVGAFIVAAIFTPPDVLSQLLLAIPLCLLYELGLQIARFLVKPAPAAGPDEAAAS